MKKKNQKHIPNNSFTEFLLYTTANGKVKVEIFLRDENIWLTQEKIALLFGVQRPAITKHFKNIFDSGELNEKVVSSILEHTTIHGAIEGKTQNQSVKFYNLDAILSVGYRVNSSQATQFRIWATERLREYIIKGFTMDDERLKDPYGFFGQDYFEEQLARIRNIRSSERRMYQKVTDIYAQCSADYNPNEEITKLFFATVQNKLHFAITGQTAAEIIYDRVDNKKPNIGLIVTMYLDYAEMQSKKGIIMYMKDWVIKLDSFLKFNEEQILQDNGKISHEVAEALALEEYEKYRVIQDKNYISDFDREVVKLVVGGSKPKKNK